MGVRTEHVLNIFLSIHSLLLFGDEDVAVGLLSLVFILICILLWDAFSLLL
jgi:uncharacterized membrane protein YgaE (UPF0421/DUF939 family)